MDSVSIVSSIAQFEVMSAADRKSKMFVPNKTTTTITGRQCVESALIRTLLYEQCKIACHCNILCNFGIREFKSSKHGIDVFINCGRNRNEPHRGKGECQFFGQTTLKKDYMWVHAPHKVTLGIGKYVINPHSPESRKRKRQEDIEQRAREDVSIIGPCPVCKYVSPTWARLTEEQKKGCEFLMKQIAK